MPSSLAGNPLAFLRGAGGGVNQPGPTADAPMDPMAQLASMDGGGGGGGDGIPGMGDMNAAQMMAPQILAQQQTEYFKKFLKYYAKILRDLMRAQGIGPKAVGRIGAAVTNLHAAANDLDKEKPEEADPVQSLLAMGMMSKPSMGTAPPMTTLPVMR